MKYRLNSTCNKFLIMGLKTANLINRSSTGEGGSGALIKQIVSRYIVVYYYKH
jgi:hypothetical protein